MTILTDGDTFRRFKGDHNLNVTIGTGTWLLEYDPDGNGFVPIDDASGSVSTTVNVRIPDCDVKATLTGDATVSMNRISSD